MFLIAQGLLMLLPPICIELLTQVDHVLVLLLQLLNLRLILTTNAIRGITLLLQRIELPEEAIA
jgi:hypothetical protein